MNSDDKITMIYLYFKATGVSELVCTCSFDTYLELIKGLPVRFETFGDSLRVYDAVARRCIDDYENKTKA